LPCKAIYVPRTCKATDEKDAREEEEKMEKMQEKQMK